MLGLVTMAVSAKTGSVALAAILPFALLFLPALLLNSEHALVSQTWVAAGPAAPAQPGLYLLPTSTRQGCGGACPPLRPLYVPPLPWC